MTKKHIKKGVVYVILLLFLCSCKAVGQEKMSSAKLSFTVSSSEIPLATLSEHLASLNMSNISIQESNDSLTVTCTPIFEKQTIQKLIEKGFTYELYPGVELPITKGNSMTTYSSNYIDTAAVKAIQQLPEIAALSLHNDWFVWKEMGEDYYNLYIINKNNPPIVSHSDIEKITFGIVDKDKMIEITHSSIGQKKFFEYTRVNKNKPAAILIQKYMVSSPYIIDEIDSPQIWILGAMTDNELAMSISLLFFHPYWEQITISNCKMKNIK